MAEEPQYHNIVVFGKPLFDILSKLPSKSLLRFRCISKLWREDIDDSYFVSVHDKQVIEDPTPIIFSRRNYTLCFQAIESDTNHVLKAKNKVPVKKLFSPNFIPQFAGSCNGLVVIMTKDPKADDDLMPTFTVIHPINKQCYVLPPLPSKFMSEPCNLDSFGLGFDSSTNTFKMVCVLYKPCSIYWGERRPHCTIVHVFGTNSWHTIPQVPSYNIKSGKAIFAHGCLHWLIGYNRGGDGTRQVIWFDVKNEEFGLIEPPKRNNIYLSAYLVNLDGHVGFVGDEGMVWLLNDKKEWMLHCDFKDQEFPQDTIIWVLGSLNKDRDILIKASNWTKNLWYYIYNLKNRVMHVARTDGLDLEDRCATELVMFPNSLLDIITNSNLFKNKSL